MGWLYMTRHHMGEHATAKDYLDAQFTWEHTLEDGTIRTSRALASSCLRNQVYYAAAEPSVDGIAAPVFAIVCLVRWNPRDKEGFIFGYKDMDEQMGPCEAECPQRILAMLGPTSHEHALDWRRRCLETIARHGRRVEDGTRIKLAEALRFSDGHVGDEFIVEPRGRRLAFVHPGTGGRYRISRFMDRAWAVVPESRIHRTLFVS